MDQLGNLVGLLHAGYDYYAQGVRMDRIVECLAKMVRFFSSSSSLVTFTDANSLRASLYSIILRALSR